MLEKLKIALFLAAATGAQTLLAANFSTNVVINGQELSQTDLHALEAKLGIKVVQGNYLVNYQTGCWLNLSKGNSGCVGGNSAYNSRYGSGSYNTQGNWNHWSNAAGGAVGGSKNGCVYTTFGWSNC
jgi:hypothetical protein